MKTLMWMLLTSILLFGIACQKNGPKPYVMSLPERFRFTVLDSKVKTPDQKGALYFLQNGQRWEVTGYELEPFPANFSLSGYAYSSRDAPMFSGDNDIRDFYLEMNGDVDTVYLEVEKHQQATTAGGLYSYRKVRFNGQDIAEQYQPGMYVYVFRKR